MRPSEKKENSDLSSPIRGTAGRLIVIGGGAAGFFCAVNAARMNPLLQVILLEKSRKLLSKVKISGGGRCNVTHALFDIGEMSRVSVTRISPSPLAKPDILSMSNIELAT